MQISEDTEHLIFDFDETIATLDIDWDSWLRSVAEIYKKYEPSFDESISGYRIALLQNQFFKKYGTKLKKEVDDFTRQYETENAKGIFPIQKTIELIKNTNGKNMYIWSSNDTNTIKKFLGELEILDKFKLIIGHEMVDFIKPEPDGFNKYFRKLGKVNTFLMIGNSSHDRGAAKNSGIDYLDVTEF